MSKIRVIEVPLGEDGRFNLPALSELLEHLLRTEAVRLVVLSSGVSMPRASRFYGQWPRPWSSAV